MCENWIDAVLWLGVSFVFLYTWLLDTEADKGIGDSARIKEAQDRLIVSIGKRS